MKVGEKVNFVGEMFFIHTVRRRRIRGDRGTLSATVKEGLAAAEVLAAAAARRQEPLARLSVARVAWRRRARNVIGNQGTLSAAAYVGPTEGVA